MTPRLRRLLRAIPARCATTCETCRVSPLTPLWNPRGMWGPRGLVGEIDAPDHRSPFYAAGVMPTQMGGVFVGRAEVGAVVGRAPRWRVDSIRDGRANLTRLGLS
jgi:hypothetical protein